MSSHTWICIVVCSIAARITFCTTNAGSLNHTNFMLNYWSGGCNKRSDAPSLAKQQSHHIYVQPPHKPMLRTREHRTSHTHTRTVAHTQTHKDAAVCRTSRKTLSCSAGRTNTANSKKSIDLSFHSKILNWDLLNSKKSPLVLFQTIREHNVAWERGRGSDER